MHRLTQIWVGHIVGLNDDSIRVKPDGDAMTRSPTRQRRPAGSAVLAGGLVLLVGCGSTVDAAGPVTAVPGVVSPPAQSGMSGPVAAVVPPGNSVGTSGGVPATALSGSGPASAAPPTATNRRRAPGATGHLATAAPLRVGVLIPSGNAGAAFGVDASNTPPDQAEKELRALAEQINARGGFGGHPIRLSFARMDKTDESEGTYTRIQNGNCVKLTEDDKVSFVINALAYTNYANECYVKHHVPLFMGTGASLEQWRQWSPWLMPALGVGTARMAKLMPDEWQRSGFLTRKMGVIAFDRTPERPYATQYLKPGIESRGGKVLAISYIDLNYDQIAAQTASAVLQYKRLGIDRVVFLAPGGGEWMVFARQAETQNYHPRYGISTLDSTNFIDPLISPNQKSGATGPGVTPASDVPPGERPPTNERAQACWRYLNHETGSAYATEDQNGLFALVRCEVMYAAEAGWRAMLGRPLDPTLVQSSFFAIGASYKAILFPALDFRPGEADTQSVYRQLVYDSNRQHFRYVGPYRRITV